VNLEGLQLADNPVTDRGLEHLRGLTKLKELYIRGTRVTDEGIKKLQAAIPSLVTVQK
jgi:hypothetical protein